MSSDLNSLFAPKAICIVGASRDEHKIGNITIKNIVNGGYKGKIYPINPNAQSILDLPCFPNVSALPEVPDLAIVAVPSDLVIQVINELFQKGIKNAVVFSAGFKEIGGDGVLFEEELTSTASKLGINLLGPNCLGFLSSAISLNATFSEAPIIPGNLRFISQSGAIASSIFDWMKTNNLGVDEFITLGNKAVITENEILEYWLSKGTSSNSISPIVLYLESIANGNKFLDLVSRFTVKQPVIILKPGKSQEAKNAMMSHTGSLAGEYAVMQAAFDKAGLITCNGLEDMFDFSLAFSWTHVPKGPNVAIISNAGGPAVISSDLVSTYDLKLAGIPQETKDVLSRSLPRATSLLNPIDLLGDAMSDRYKKALEAVLPLSGVDSVVVLLTPQVMTQITETAEVIGEMSKRYDKPILCSFIGGGAFLKGYEILCDYKIASYEFPERAIKTLSAMWKWQQRINKPVSNLVAEKSIELSPTDNNLIQKTAKAIKSSAESNKKLLDAEATMAFAHDFDLTLPPETIVGTVSTAKNFAKQHGYPVVLKVVSTDDLHKTELGGVKTNIGNEKELISSFESMKKLLKGDAVVKIQKQITNGVEVIIGIKSDPTFGKVLMFGAGGTLAELIRDTNLFVNPKTYEDLYNLVNSSKIVKVLNGYRNTKQYNIKRLVEMLGQVAALSNTFPEIKEIEINPAILSEDAVYVVDLKVLI